MIAEETINRFIRDTINLIVGLPEYTIKAKQYDAPIPEGPYATVDFTYERPLSTGGWRRTDNVNGLDIDSEYRVPQELMFSINFYRDNAVDNCRLTTLGFKRESIIELINAANLGFIRFSDSREVSVTEPDTWEERCQVDLFLNAVGSDADIIKAILSVDMSAVYQSNGMEYTTTIEVN